MHDVRPAAVAGMFYPGSPAALAESVRSCLADATARAPVARGLPKAVIVPHAGYVYSGPIAGAAYARLAAGRRTIRRVVLLGPAHRVAVRGLALPTARAFATPLGVVEVDRKAALLALALPQVQESDAAHALEHSLEVQLPFLQAVLDEFRIVPFAVGDATADEVADVIDRLWGGPETLIVISSDLSHYHRYAEARAIDRGTADADPRARRRRSITSRLAARRRSMDSSLARGGAGSRRNSSTCAIRATPQATSRAWSATHRSRSRR